MSDENREKIYITFKKGRTKSIGQDKERTHSLGTTVDRTPTHATRSVLSQVSRSDDVHFFLLEGEESRLISEITVSKKPIPNNTIGRVELLPKQSKNMMKYSFHDEYYNMKVDIVRSILESIIGKLDDMSTISEYSSYLKPSDSAKLTEKISKEYFIFKSKSLKRSAMKLDQKDKSVHDKLPSLNSIIRNLDLPIEPSLKKPSLHTRPKLQLLSFENLISKSSLIIPKTASRSEGLTFSGESEIASEEEEPPLKVPFELCWCFGFDPDVPIINLSDKEKSIVFFANSQYAVLYDFHANTMRFLQGHRNQVTCLSTDARGTVLVTADSGYHLESNRVIIWDNRPCILGIIDDPHPRGCSQVGLSYNGNVLVTVSAYQAKSCIRVWDWRNNKDFLVEENVEELMGEVKKVTMNQYSEQDFAVTFENGVTFSYIIGLHTRKTAEGKGTKNFESCNFYTVTQFPSKLGKFTDTLLLGGDKEETRAFSSTDRGYVVVWDNESISSHKKKYKKHVRLYMDSILSIQAVDNCIVISSVVGNIGFYNRDLTILYSEKIRLGNLMSVSFNLTPQIEAKPITRRGTKEKITFQDMNACEKHDSCAKIWRKEPKQLVDMTLTNKPFSSRQFIITTDQGRMAYINLSSGIPKYLMFPNKSSFTAMDIFPKSNFLCVGTSSGQCFLFKTDDHKLKVSRQLQVSENACQAVSCIRYSPSGQKLACGMYTGQIWLLDPLILTPITYYSASDHSNCITELVFTPDSNYLITIDVSYCVSTYSVVEKITLMGQFIAHNQPINNVFISPYTTDQTKFTVCTLSKDRTLTEFIIDKETQVFKFASSYRVEQTAIPLSVIPYPLQSQYITINSEMKFKLLDPTTFKCCKTLQAPDLGFPIFFQEMFKNEGEDYLLFATVHHIGLHMLPIDGNPYKALGLRASPTDIICCKIHPSGKYVFTISEHCRGISKWIIKTAAVKDFHKKGGQGLQPFLAMLKEGKEKDIRQFFQLGQFLHQGEGPRINRILTNRLPLCEVANVLQALGCLLTKHEIEDITTEMIGPDPTHPRDYIEYEDFIPLYLNHRSNTYLTLGKLRKAFLDFYEGAYFRSNDLSGLMITTEPIFDAHSFVQKLLAIGEPMSPSELNADLSILTGGQPEFDLGLMQNIPPTMPKEITFEIFVRDILGFKVDQEDVDSLYIYARK